MLSAPRLLFAISLALATPVQRAGDPRENPRSVVRDATHAVEGDSAARVRAGWAARLARDSTDRAALLGLATLARLDYDYPLAERIYRQLVFADSLRLDRFRLYARLGLAQGLQTQGRVEGVDDLLSRARAEARALGDRSAEGEALLWLSILRANTVSIEGSLVLLDSAMRVISEAQDAPDVRAACRCRRAHMLVVLGRADASAELRGALGFARRVGEPRSEAYCLRALALELRYRHQPDSSMAVYRTLEELRRRTRDRSNLARALTWRGDVLRQEAAYGEAREVLHQALIEAQASHNLFTIAEARLMLGALFWALNDHATAANYVDEAVATYKALGDSSGLMVSRSWRSSVSAAAGDSARARREALEAIDFFRRTANVEHQWEVYQFLADLAMREGDWVAAERALDSASTIMRRHGGAASGAEQPFGRGRLALYRGNLAAAERIFTRYLVGPDSTERLMRYEARAYLAEVYARRGELARAERELTSASNDLDRWRSTLADQELRVLAFQASQSEENDRNASVARVIAALAAGGRTVAAFALAERRRARETADRILQAEALALRVALPGREPALRNVGLVTAAEVVALIPDDSTAIVEYVTGVVRAPTTVFVLTRSQAGGELVRARVLAPADTLVGQIARLVALLENGGNPGALARALGAALLDPALAAVPDAVTRLVVVPDGPLHRVPWDALRLADGRYVVERYAVSVAPSAGVIAALWRRAREHNALARGPVRLLAFGDPAFAGEGATADSTSDGVAAETYRSAFDSAGGLVRLAESGREARLVARYASEAEVRLRDRASAAYLKRVRLEPFRVIHFATHALVDERSVARTALALAPGDGESGFVGPPDLAALRLGADLVVLSACRSAGGVVVDGEGVQGLTAPLLQAGARSVVASGWRVGDRKTVRFVEDFYRSLADGLRVGEALRAAKLEALRRGAPPSEWAAFTVVGDPLVTVPLSVPRRFPLWWIVTLMVTLGLAFGYGIYWTVMRSRRGAEAR